MGFGGVYVGSELRLGLLEPGRPPVPGPRANEEVLREALGEILELADGEEIERLKRGAADEDNGKDMDSDPPRSPREFIEKRMHELDEETGDAQS